jgi:hypothetical protein
MAWFEGELVF